MAARNTGKNAEGLNVDIDIGEDNVGKAWNLSDPYRFAPKRPDGDPWKMLLDPLLEKERIECDGWKDEVGNLLIFAGLFSAVLTGFIIDSYKTLQPSDSKDIIALLSQIASNQANNTVNPDGTISSTPIQLQLPSQTFKPPPSAVRINVLWFLSLILSLAVVLIGIVCLQWLRQHQAFPSQSPRSALALYNMRVEGMRRWHVSKILMSLPVMLQAALVFFFVGVLDFLRSLQEKTILVCVAAVVGATMLFLLGTTTAPALQTVFLPFRIMMMRSAVGRDSEDKKKPPSQCPYKSPQSSVVCAFVDFILRGGAGVVGWLRPESSESEGHDDDGGEKGTGIEKGRKRKVGLVSRHLSALWSTRSWIEFDLIWLKIRDACAQNVYGGRFGKLGHLESGGVGPDEEELGIDVPLYDTMALFKGFTSKGNPKTSTMSSEVVVPAYHCLAEVSGALTLGRLTPPGRDVRGELEVVKEWNRYLRFSFDERFETLEFTSGPPSSSISHAGTSSHTAPVALALASDIIRLLHDQNLCMFLDHITGSSNTGNNTTSGKGKDVFFHRQELRTRIQLYMLAGKWSLISSFGVYPTYLEFGDWGGRGAWRDFPDEEMMFTYQYIHLINKIFGYFSAITNNTNTNGAPAIAPTDLHARAEVLVLLEECSRAISRVTAHLAARQALGYGAVGLGGRVKGMLDGVRGCLERGVDGLGVGRAAAGNRSGSGRGRPEDVLHLFYCAGMVVCGCVGLPESVGSPMPFESAYMGLKGFLKAFKKGASLSITSMSTSKAEEEEFGGSVKEVERRFREGYPNDGEVEKGLWDALECEAPAGLGVGGEGSSIPFVVIQSPTRAGRPVPLRFG